MVQIYGAIQKIGGEVLVVSFTPPAKVAAYIAKYPQPFAVVSDQARAAYHAFALGKTSLPALLRFDIMRRFLRLILRGWVPKRPGRDADIWQLGGDFILDGEGWLRYAHPSKDPADRPSRTALLEAFRQVAQADRKFDEHHDGSGLVGS